MSVTASSDINFDRVETEADASARPVSKDASARPLSDTEEKTDTIAQPILSQLEEPSPIQLEANRTSHPSTTHQGPNLLVRMQSLVALLLKISAKKSEIAREEAERLNKQFLLWANKAAEEKGANGSVYWRSALAELALNFSQYAFQDEATREAVAAISKQTPAVAKFFESQHNKREMKYSAEQNLVNQRLTNKNTEKQNDAGERQEYLELLRSAIGAFGKAAAPNA